MPPRKRRRGGSTTAATRSRSASTSATTPARKRTLTPAVADDAPSSSQSPSLSATPRRGARHSLPGVEYRTRYRRTVRGPEVAAAEGGVGDLVPPSDDDEYDAWRNRAIHSRPPPGPEDAGPSRPSPRRFRPLFSDYASSGGLSDDMEMDDVDDGDIVLGNKGKGKARDFARGQEYSPSPVRLPHDLPSSLSVRRSLSSTGSQRGMRAVAELPHTPRRETQRLGLSRSGDAGSLPERARSTGRADTDPAPSPTPSTKSPHEPTPIVASASSPTPSLSLSRLPTDTSSRITVPTDVEAAPISAPAPLSVSLATPAPSQPSGPNRVLLSRPATFLVGSNVEHGRPSSSLPPPSPTTAPASPSPEAQRSVRQGDSPTSVLREQEPTTSAQNMPDHLPDIDSHGPMDVDVPSPGMVVEILTHKESRVAPSTPPRQPPARSPDPFHFLGVLSPDSPVQQDSSQRTLSQRRVEPPPRPPPTLSQSGASRAAPSQHTSAPQQSNRPPTPPLPADPALLQFRFARTFRTRTALQLQPYTREKQLYEKALARGGLAKGKHAIAPAAVVKANKDTDTSDSADQSDNNDDDATPPDAIVIGATQEQRKSEQRKRKPKVLIDDDYDEYYVRFGEAAVDEEDEEVARRLQTIARERLREAKERRRQEREAENLRKDFEAFVARMEGNDNRNEKEREQEEREKRRAESKAEKERRQALRDKERAEKDRKRQERAREKPAAVGAPVKTPNAKNRPRVYGKRANPQKPIRPIVDLINDSSSELSDVPPSDEDMTSVPQRHQPPTTAPPDRPRSPSPRHESFDHFMADLGDDFGASPAGLVETGETESAEVVPRRTQKRRRLLASSSQSDSDDLVRHSHSVSRDHRSENTNRPGRAAAANRHSEVSDSDSESSDPGHRDKRERIARRMMPGVMLKRLEAAERAKQQRRAREAAERRRREAVVSPVRPGQAVRRRGVAGRGDGMDGMEDLWDEESSDERRQEVEDRTPRRDEQQQDMRSAKRRDSRTPTHRRRSRPLRADPDIDDDLRLEPAHVDLSFEVYASPPVRDLNSGNVDLTLSADGSPVMLGTAAEPIPFDLEASDSGRSARSCSPSPGAVVISSGSEAEENNEETLVHLHRGDFEGILRGRSNAAAVRALDHKHQTDRDKRRKRKPRPVLRIQHRSSRSDGRMLQTRLNLPVLDENSSAWEAGAVPERGPLGAARRTGGQRKITDWDDARDRASGGRKLQDRSNVDRGSRPRRDAKAQKSGKRAHGLRPAIRLDDRTIFATEEFAFDSEPENQTPVRAAPKRPFQRVTSRNDRSPATVSPRTPTTPRLLRDFAPNSVGGVSRAREETPRTRLDDGVGKARSWANFDRFPIDFDITPLPSGVYVSGSVIQDLVPFLAAMDGTVEELKPLRAFGVHLHAAMDLDEVLAVLPIVLDGVRGAVVTYMDERDRDAEDDSSVQKILAPLQFFRDLLARSSPESKAALSPILTAFGQNFDDIAVTSRSEDRPAVELLLLIRYALLQIAVIASPAHVPAAAVQLFLMLLTYGFDRTLRPIRRILRGEVETPEIVDNSVSLWVAAGHILERYGADVFATALLEALETRYASEIGPLAAERVWFLVFGLCAVGQFEATGTVAQEYTAHPRWGLVKRAIGLIKVAHSQEAEEAAQLGQLQGRDRYIKTMVARCLRLSSAWAWSFDRNSFTVATRDLGMIFKDRQHRNLPTEPPTDFPAFISEFDIALSAADTPESTRRASAFELYLHLASVAASDVIASAEELAEAHKAEKDVQRLIMSIFPLSAVSFTRASPPSARQLGALVNRYSTMVVACYFSPSLLPWLLSNSATWIDFNAAGFESRQVVIRGLMYLAVAVRHHSAPLEPVVARLAEILTILQGELETVTRAREARGLPTRVEIERTMVLVVTAFRQIILHPGYTDRGDVYPDPALLHECWLARVFELDLAKDVKSGLEIVSTIQAYLDARSRALPKRAAAARKSAHESIDDYPSLGFDFDAVDLAALGGDEGVVDPIEAADVRFAEIVRDTICPKIYRLLSDLLPPILEHEGDEQIQARTDRQVLIAKLTKCWSDCAAVVVVEHRLMDWSSYVGPFGQQSWSRLGNEAGRVQVGLHFMLNVAQLDPSAFRSQEEEFLALLFQALVADRLTIQHKYVATLFGLPGALDHALLNGVQVVLRELFPGGTDDDGEPQVGSVEFTRTTFLQHRPRLLGAIFRNIAPLLRSRHTPAELKSLVYRCVNLVVAAMASCEAQIDERRVLHRESYRAFVRETVAELRRTAGDYVTPVGVPALKSLEWVVT